MLAKDFIIEVYIHDMDDVFKKNFIQAVKKYKTKNNIPEWDNDLNIPYLRSFKKNEDWVSILDVLEKLIVLKPFDNTTTGMPVHTEMMNKPEYFKTEKNKIFEIVEMKPYDYIHKCALGFKQSQDALRATRDIRYVDKILNGETFPMLTLDYSNEYFGQEGLHRALAAEHLGIRKIPVMVIRKNNESE